jgi:cobyrinic acid a,c-diamide synthase
MSRLPRVAIGTIQPEADLRPVLWAFLESLRKQGLQVQSFLSQACFTDYLGVATLTGLNPRHLDSWLMTPELCREVFVRGTRGCDFGLVEGRFLPPAAGRCEAGGLLETLCDWLDLPAVAVVDLSHCCRCRLPSRPVKADGLLLDGLAEGQFVRVSTELESLWGIPVLGGLSVRPEVRRAVAEIAAGERPSRELCRALRHGFDANWQGRRLGALALRSNLRAGPRRLFRRNRSHRGVTIALAYDEAFNCYFPDTLDLLELRGARLVAFSPLRDDRLPEDADVVFLGCGHPERFARQLSQNDCMKLQLRSHARRGGRIYAEGGGVAYLCQHVLGPQGELHRMLGLLPAVARLENEGAEPVPVEFRVARPSWFAPSGLGLRGYRNSGWVLEPTGPLTSCACETSSSYDLVVSGGTVASRVSFNLAAQPQLLDGFLRPRRVPLASQAER